MAMTYEKAIDRVRKLLKLAEHAGSDEEAATAATRAAALMAEYQLSRAEIQLAEGDDKRREAIVEASIEEAPKVAKRQKRVAWKSTIAYAVAESFGAKMFWLGARITIYGRESAVQATSYTCEYLYREVDRLCEEAWEAADQDEKHDTWYLWNDKLRKHEPVKRSAARAWRNAFRNGAANTIAARLEEDKEERREAARQTAREFVMAKEIVTSMGHKAEVPKLDALALVEREEREIESAYERRSKDFKSGGELGQVSSSGGYSAGKTAGQSISIGGKRAGLGAGQGRLK